MLGNGKKNCLENIVYQIFFFATTDLGVKLKMNSNLFSKWLVTNPHLLEATISIEASVEKASKKTGHSLR